MTTTLLTVPVSILFGHNRDDKIIDMKLKSSLNNTMLCVTTAALHEKPADTIEE